jgi:hypothetical protein
MSTTGYWNLKKFRQGSRIMQERSEPIVDLPEAMKQLAKQRSIFHSEADFQHALAWYLRETVPGIDVRLEYPTSWRRGAIDIFARFRGRELGIEVKYLCRRLEIAVGDEIFLLKQQGAQDVRAYDVCKDIKRMERFATERPDAQAAVIVLSNDALYWTGPRSQNTCYAAFTLQEGRLLTGSLGWSEMTGAGTNRGRTKLIQLRRSYDLRWQEYSNLRPHAGQFQFLHIAVAPKN